MNKAPGLFQNLKLSFGEAQSWPRVSAIEWYLQTLSSLLIIEDAFSAVFSNSQLISKSKMREIVFEILSSFCRKIVNEV